MNTAIQNLLDTFNSESDYIRKAHILHTLRREHELPVKEIASHIKKHSSYVSHLLRLTSLPEIIIDGYYSSQLTFAHLVVISRLSTPELMIQAYETILKDSLNSAQTEHLIRKLKFNIESDTTRVPPERLVEIAKCIEKQFPQSKVEISQSHIGAKILIKLSGNTESTTRDILWMGDQLAKSQTEVHTPPEELIILE